jgi:uncharacterized delta-60 repeat protein
LSGKGRSIDINGKSEGFNSVRIDHNGKIVVGGYMTETPGLDRGMLFGRLNVDGTTDTSFAGGSGFGVNYLSTADDEIEDIALDPSTGAVFFAGSSVLTSSSSSMKILKYDASGSLVTGFGSGGVFTHTEAPVVGGITYLTGWAKAIKRLPDGKLLVGGHRYDGNIDGVIIKINADGSGLDTNFGSSGVINSYHNFNNDMISDMAVQADGKIIVVGTKLVSNNDWMILRYTSAGALDSSFNATGERVMDAGGASTAVWDRLFGVAIDAEGSIYGVGHARSSSGVLDGASSSIGIVKLLCDGN